MMKKYILTEEQLNKVLNSKVTKGIGFIEKYGHKCPTGVKGRNSDNKLYLEKIGWSVNKPLLDGLITTFNWVNSNVTK